MKWKAYPVYKDSVVEWLGQIPEHWELSRIKNLGLIKYGLGEPPPQSENGFLFVRATDFHAGKIILDSIQRVDPNGIPWSRKPSLQADDIIVVRSGAYTGDSTIIPEELSGAIAGYDMVLRIKRANPRFISYAFLSKYLLYGQIYLEKMRAAQPHLNAEELGGCIIIVPPATEQLKITKLLDRETVRIDTLIEKKQKQIELLQEKRTALITRAVTKGLDPNVPMKDSGVEWLGQIPEHWDLCFLRRKLKNGQEGIKIGPFGSQLKLESMENSGYKVYGQENIIANDFKLGRRYIGNKKFEELFSCAIQCDDILVTMMGVLSRLLWKLVSLRKLTFVL